MVISRFLVKGTKELPWFFQNHPQAEVVRSAFSVYGVVEEFGAMGWVSHDAMVAYHGIFVGHISLGLAILKSPLHFGRWHCRHCRLEMPWIWSLLFHILDHPWPSKISEENPSIATWFHSPVDKYTWFPADSTNILNPSIEHRLVPMDYQNFNHQTSAICG